MDVNGQLADLVGKPLLVVEEEVNPEGQGPPEREYVDSYTWTFYRLATEKGWVVIRWLGESNGYYSESVSFMAE